MNRTDEGALAWALVDSVPTFLNPTARAAMCAKIGAGELDSAIRDLLVFYANSQTELPRDLAPRVLAWLQGYKGSNTEQMLRRIYDCIRLSGGKIAIRPQPEMNIERLPQRLIAGPSAHAARISAIRQSAHLKSCGVSIGVKEPIEAAVEARPATSTAVEAAVREARSVDWSWDQISAALGGTPNAEALRRRFGFGQPAFD